MLHSGSKWFRWDPHIHIPGTVLNNQYSIDLETFVSQIENLPKEIVALGITDYLLTRSYRRVLEFRKNGRMSNIALLFPNIEFRITPPTKRQKAINLHLLVNPEASDHLEQLEEALGRLTVEYGGLTISPVETSLLRWGKQRVPTESDEGALREAVSQYKVDFSIFRKWYTDCKWFDDNALIAVAADHDGLEGLRHDNSFRAFHDEIARFSNIIFSGKPGDRDYWLGRGSDDQLKIRQLYGALKPCINGSDAHSEDRIAEAYDKRFCWIKSIPSWDGLRQILIEPEERVFIGEQPSALMYSHPIIESVEISRHSQWFRENPTTLRLNSGVNCIIGPKGSGKTALADCIAGACRAWIQERDATSFFARASKEITGLVTKVVWRTGETEQMEWSPRGPRYEDGKNSGRPSCKYLSQQFVEHLCDDTNGSASLIAEIEDVLFSHIPNLDRGDASTFEELRETLLVSVKQGREDIVQRIRSMNKDIEEINDRAKRQNEHKETLKELEKTIYELKKNEQEQSHGIAPEVLKEISTIRDTLESLEKKLAERKERSRKLEELLAYLMKLAQQLEVVNAKTRALATAVNLPEKDIDGTMVVFGHTDYNEPILRLNQTLKVEIETIGGTEENPQPNTLSYVRKQLETRQKSVMVDETRKRQLADTQKRLADAKTKSEKLTKELEETAVQLRETRPQLHNQRLELYAQYFTSLGDEMNILKNLYKPAQVALDSGGDERQDLGFDVRLRVDVKRWVERGETMLDQRKSRHKVGPIRELAEQYLVQPWESGSGEAVRKAFAEFLKDKRVDHGSNLVECLGVSYRARDIADWLFELDHVALEYALMYQGTDLRKLSPGTRGIALLVFFLALDTDDARPLLIDQPEENLDNQSVYEVLTQYFRRCRVRRQVIMVTHNPNLVVNTDADLVIVANSIKRSDGSRLPTFSYASGPLESVPEWPRAQRTIRQHVCAVLEGGEAAFKAREQKYRLRQT